MNTPISIYGTRTFTTTIDAAFCSDFTGKELDSETGYSYFGMRYFAPATLVAWLSVDPTADKYPGISPYAYCAWNRPTGGHKHLLINFNLVNNPLKLVDPEGMNSKKNENQNKLGAHGTAVQKAERLTPSARSVFGREGWCNSYKFSILTTQE